MNKYCYLLQFDCKMYDFFDNKINNKFYFEYLNDILLKDIDKIFVLIKPTEKIVKCLNELKYKYIICENKVFQYGLLNELKKLNYDYFIRIIANNLFVSNKLTKKSIKVLEQTKFEYLNFYNFSIGLTPTEIFKASIINQIQISKELYYNFRSFSFIKSKVKSYTVKSHLKNEYSFLNLSINKKIELKKILDYLKFCGNDKIDFYDILKSGIYQNLVEKSKVFNWMNKIILNSELNEKEVLNKKTDLNSKPEEVCLFVTEKCNIKCKFCDRKNNSDYENMGFDKVKQILKKILPVKLLNLTSWGEPFFYPKFKELIKFLKEEYPYQNWRVTTNGLIIDEEILEIINSTSITDISISVNAGNKEVYKKISGKNNFNILLKNLQKIIKIRKGYNVFSSFVACKSNIESLPEYVKLMADIGIDSLRVMYMIICNENDKKESLFYYQKLSNDIFDKALEQAEKSKIILNLPSKFKKNNSENKQTKICYDFWNKLYIQPNGNIQPCCYYDKSMGNMFQNNFFGIWNNKKYLDYRENIIKRKFWRCNVCPIINVYNVDELSYHLNYGMLN